MPFPYKKMTQEDFDAVRRMTDPSRVWVGEEIAAEYYHDEMPEYYSKIDLYICTSSIEGTPNPVLEAMACGVPVISTDVGVVPEVFGEYQRNYILERRDVECLKATIKRMLSNPENLKKCSLENLQQIQQWSWKQKCEQYGRFFSEAYRRKVHRRME